ncbi:recombinase family protein [Streptomyces sp. NBC_01186]|uniref:recombinase family protein n=1 Tax=Streptomyces sp. NBC_01186 TaxID=2903765 RepID=UPI002E0D5E89|nr:recombinase family protein [Streptomyces sp. NBC_01186]
MARKAADGKPLHGLEPDLKTASVVVRIFTAFLPGYGIYAIAEGLTRDGIPRPSAHDPRRNPHRDTRAWAKSAVRAILDNPRYTGRQVWNRQKKHESLLDITDVSLGYTTKMRWNTQDKWIISKKIVHTPLIDDATFARAQDIFHSKTRTGPAHGVQRTRRPYLLRGALICGVCERKMQGHWSHEQAYYRCRYPNEYGLANHVQHPRNLYVREAWVTRPLDDWPAKAFLPHRIDKTVDLMTATGPDTGHPDTTESTQARADIARCDAKLATHRSALEAGADPGLVTRWITDAGRTGPGRGETTTSPHKHENQNLAELRHRPHRYSGRPHSGDPPSCPDRQSRDLSEARSPHPLHARTTKSAGRGAPQPAHSRHPWGTSRCPRGVSSSAHDVPALVAGTLALS